MRGGNPHFDDMFNGPEGNSSNNNNNSNNNNSNNNNINNNNNNSSSSNNNSYQAPSSSFALAASEPEGSGRDRPGQRDPGDENYFMPKV
jgi:hypothetical protein